MEVLLGLLNTLPIHIYTCVDYERKKGVGEVSSAQDIIDKIASIYVLKQAKSRSLQNLKKQGKGE